LSLGGGGANKNSSYTIANGASLVFSGGAHIFENTALTLMGGNITLNSNLQLNLQGGSLNGNGTITGNILNSGIINPGLSIGKLDIDGNFSQQQSGVIHIEIGGTGLMEYDQINISNTANFNGIANITLLNGYTPVIGDQFSVINYGNYTGNLQFNATNLQPGLKFDTKFTNNSLILKVVGNTSTAPTLAITATNGDRPEGNTGNTPFTFTVNRSGNATGTNNVNWAVTGTGTNPANAADFAGGLFPTGTLSFAAGETSKVITVNVQGDTIVEPNETFRVALSNPTNGATITTATAQGTIQNDDVVVSTNLAIAATTASQTEGNSGSKAFTFTVNRSGSTTGANNVNWAVTGTGTNPANATDFVGGVLPSGTVSFAAGQTSKVITVNVQGDTTVEPNETFRVTLSNPNNGATITTATAQGIIQNDDSVAIATNLAITATNANRPEGDGWSTPFTFTVNRSGSTTGANNVNWTVTGVGTNPANATDFVGGVLPSGTVSFAAGETSKIITVRVKGDTTPEPNETFRVTLSNPTNGATITTATAQGIIQNDDNAAVATNLAITATNANRPEGDGWSTPFTFTVNRSGSTTGSNTVNWTVTGTGTNPANATDFVGGVLPSGTVSFAAGETGKIITVRVKGDTTPEPNETFRVTLSNPSNGATITTATAQGTIQNDDGNGASGSTFTGTSANNTLNGTTGADTLIGLAGNDTYIVNHPGDVVVENPNEGTDTVRASISYTLPNNVENLTLTGSANINGTGNTLNNRLVGNDGNNILNGGAGRDILTGKGGNDIFVFQFGQSTVSAMDRITDFAIGADKIDLLTQSGAATGKPWGLTRAADSTATNINTIVANVFADANGAQAGNQPLGINRAALVKANTATYLIINDRTAGFQSSSDLVINLTGITGTLPALGLIPVNSFFV